MTNEREKAQAVRPVVEDEATPYVLAATVLGSLAGSLQIRGLRVLCPLAELADAIHVAAATLEGEGYDATASRLRACVVRETSDEK